LPHPMLAPPNTVNLLTPGTRNFTKEKRPAGVIPASH
jgi:hypothetical protein